MDLIASNDAQPPAPVRGHADEPMPDLGIYFPLARSRIALT